MTIPMPEKVAVALLKDDAELAAIHEGRVSTDLLLGGPALRVTLAGDMRPANDYDQAPMFQVDCWAEDQIVAGELAALVRERWRTYRRVSAAGGYVSGSWIVQGPVWMPDPKTEMPRYLVTVAFYLSEME